MKIAFVFPGQGSQYVGMGKEIYENFNIAREIFEEASDALGYDLANLSLNGPAEELDKTFITQPCIVTVSTAINKVLSEKGLKPSVVLGHSLGEYSALVAAEVLSLKDAVRLTEKRGQFMREAVPEGQGLVAAIIGLERDKVDEICKSINSGYVAPANYNCPGQIVIAGEKAAIEEVIMLAKDAGAKRVIPLSVSVPSHCSLMKEASRKLGKLFDTIQFNAAKVPIVSNTYAKLLDKPEEIKEALKKQLYSPVLWEDSVRIMVKRGLDIFIEVGPGKVLSGLIRRIDMSVKVFNVEDTITLSRTLNSLSL